MPSEPVTGSGYASAAQAEHGTFALGLGLTRKLCTPDHSAPCRPERPGARPPLEALGFSLWRGLAFCPKTEIVQRLGWSPPAATHLTVRSRVSQATRTAG